MPDIEVRSSAIHGKGVFALARIPRRSKIGELTGELITVREARRRAEGLSAIAIVEFEDGMALDASRGGNELRYVNHSCSPNAYLRRAPGHRVEFYSLRAIKAGDEVTCDYGETHHEGTLPCRCGSEQCRSML